MALRWIADLVGTATGYFRLGLTGVRLKNSGGNLLVRNAGDSADAELTTSKVKVSGNVLELNSDAAGAGADWKLALQRPATGMTADVTLTLPPDDGSPSQVLATDGDGTLTWISAASTASAQKDDTTTLDFGSTSPVAMFTLPGDNRIISIAIIIDTAFDDAPTMSVGVAGDTSKYVTATQVSLTDPAQSAFEVSPNLDAAGADEALIITYSSGSATVGSARVVVTYDKPD